MKVTFLMVCEVEVTPESGQDAIYLAQRSLDYYRQASMPNNMGISLFRVHPESVDTDGPLLKYPFVTVTPE